MLFHAWNVGDLDQMALPHCHMVYQCHVTSQGALNMAIFQRSADAFLGLPWNQIGGSVLLLMLAEQAGLKPGELELGRASCRERVWQYVSISVVAVTLTKQRQESHLRTRNTSHTHHYNITILPNSK